MSFETRAAENGDVDALTAIETSVFSGDRLSRRSFARFIASRSASLLVADDEEGIAGYCLVLFRAGTPSARLYSIAVAPGRQGQGMGGLLLGAAEQAAVARACVTLRLEVREDNGGAVALYRRHGYRSIGRREGYYEDGMPALRFEKTLNPPGIGVSA